LQTTTTTAAATVSSETPAASATSTPTNVAGIDLALLVDQLTRTGSSPEMTATILSTLVATSPDAGPEEQKQILQKLTDALRERQRQIGLQKLGTTITTTASTSSSSSVSSSATTVSTSVTTVTSVVGSTTSKSVATFSASTLPSLTVTSAGVARQDESLQKPAITSATEPAAKPSEPVFSKTSTIPLPAVSVVPTPQQWVSSKPASTSPLTYSPVVGLLASTALPVTIPATSMGTTPPTTSALPPAIQQLLSGKSFENLKSILANVTGRKTGGSNGGSIPDPSSSVVSTDGSVVRSHETLDSYTTSKGSQGKMAPESDVLVPAEKPVAEQEDLFVANIHGDVDYRMRPPMPTEPPPPNSMQPPPPFAVAQPGWPGDGGQFPLSGIPTSQQPVSGVSPRVLLPGQFPPNSGIQPTGGAAPAMPPHAGKAQGLLPTPETSKPSSGVQEERVRENREGQRQNSEDVENDTERSCYKDRRPYDDRSSSQDDYRRGQSSRERSDNSEQRREGRFTDQTFTRKAGSSSWDRKDRSAPKVPPPQEAPIVIEDDLDIPLPPPTTASKTSGTNAPPADVSASKSFDADRKTLLPTPRAKQSSTAGKRKSEEPQREQKFSRSWEHRRSLKTSPGSSSKSGSSETKGKKKALLETPVGSASSKSFYERHRSRSKSRTRHVASSLLDRSRRKFGGLARHHRSSSRERRRSAARDVVRRRSRSRERTAARSTSRDQLEEEEQRLRKQLDELIARKNEGNRSKEYSPSFDHDQRREHSPGMPPMFNVMQNPSAGIDIVPPHPRHHLLPAPHLIPGNIRGRALLEAPPVLRPLPELPRQIGDRNIIPGRYGHPANQPSLPSDVMLPSRPFVQEYSHKPAEAQTDQISLEADRGSSRRHPEPGQPAFREDRSQHRYRPYPVPEERHRMPPESAERVARNRHVRDRQNKETVDRSSPKTSDARAVNVFERTPAGIEKVGLSDTSTSQRSSPAIFSAVDQKPVTSQFSPSTSSAPVITSEKPELPVVGDGLLPLSSAPGFFPEASLDTPSSKQALDTTKAPENETPPALTPNMPPPPCPPLPFPPNFPAIVQHVRNVMFARGSGARLPFNQMPRPRIRGPPLRPSQLGFLVPPETGPAVVMSAPPVSMSGEVSATSKKSLLGDYPVVPLLPEFIPGSSIGGQDAGPGGIQLPGEAAQQSGESTDRNDSDDSASRLMAPPRITLESSNPPTQQYSLVTGVEDDQVGEYPAQQGEEDESGDILPLMDFDRYRGRPSSAEGGPPSRPLPMFRPRIPLPHVRGAGRMPPGPGHGGMPYGMRTGPRGLTPRGSAGFPHRGGRPFSSRGAPRY